ncbi:MAG TPA: eL32 family ribosomal protein [Candidatus Nanoarchaeia archaeon]|nr:eL32 family ribosomal protein [Candidatus Nanoarchaeia archaeon]
MVKFLRRDVNRFAKFGKGRGKKATWRKPKGRDNKMREKRKGYPAVVSVGYRKNKNLRGTIKEKSPIEIMNVNDLKKMGKENIGIVGNVGKKKKIEIVKKAYEMKIELKNINVKAFLKKLNKAVAPEGATTKPEKKNETK